MLLNLDLEDERVMFLPILSGIIRNSFEVNNLMNL
jgi:hypothetical protein